MGNKKKRNKPCACGSGKLFRNCHMGNRTHSDNVTEEAKEQTKERKLDPEQAKIMNEMMDAFEKQEKQKHDKGSKVLQKLIEKEITDDEKLSCLISLGANSLIPDNQPLEQRFLKIALSIISGPLHLPASYVNLKKIYKAFDKHFGASYEMAEIDTQQQIYISWVKFKGQYYRIFTGTLAEGEVYLQDQVWKYESVLKSLPDDIGVVDKTLGWAFKKIDEFINQSGLKKYESSNGADFSNNKILTDSRTQSLTQHLASNFVLDKNDLTKEVKEGLAMVSLKNTEYEGEDLWKFYKKPIIDFGGYYVIPFPQLLIPALLSHVFEQAATSKNKEAIRSRFKDSAIDRLTNTLKVFFGKSSVLEKLTLSGEDWADLCIRYDGKLIFVSIATSLSGENLSDIANKDINKILSMYRKAIQDKSLSVGSLKGSPTNFKDQIDKLEPIAILVVDNLGEDLMFALGETKEKVFQDVIPLSGLEFIIHNTKSPLQLIRYLRAIDDLRNRKISMPGATPTDLYCMYEEGVHQLRETTQDPNMLMIDLTGGARKITEVTRSKRKKSALIELDGEKHYMHKHWENFYGKTTEKHMLLYRTDVTPKIKIAIPFSKNSSDELRHSIYITFDSLCYFLDQKHSSLAQVLPKDILSIDITVKAKENQKQPLSMKILSRNQNSIKIEISVSNNGHKVFMSDSNDGERKVVGLFASVLGIKSPDQWLDAVLPASTKRNFQTNVYSLSHKSYENAPKPLVIEDGDRWWVDERLSRAVLDDGMKPGTYTDPRQIGELATRISKIAKGLLLKELAKYPRQEVIERSYQELEAVYAWDERKGYETLANIAIREDEETVEKHRQYNQDSTQLSFAHRYLIEASLQSQDEGDELLTEEAFLEILSLAERYVDVEFWGDTTFLGLQPGQLYISKRGFPVMESTGNGKLLSKKRVLSSLKSAKYRSDIRDSVASEGPPEPRAREKKMYSDLNEPFKNEFGYTLEHFIEVCKALIDLFSGLDSPIVMIPKKVLVLKLSKDSTIDKDIVEKIVQRLILSRETLEGVDINPSQRFWREERLINKPLVTMPLNTNVLLFTRAVVERMVLSFLDRLMSGRLEYLKNNQKSDLNKAVMNIVNQDASEFEDAVCDALKERNLEVRKRCKSIGGTSVPKQGVGEIDGLCWHQSKKTLYVLEIKDNDPARSPVEIKTEMDNFFGRDKKKGYYKQLEDKYNWVNKNQNLLRKEFDIGEKIKLKIKPVLVSNAIVASSILKEAPLTTFTLDEFINSLD